MFYLKCFKYYPKSHDRDCVETKYYDSGSITSARLEAIRMLKRNKCGSGSFVQITELKGGEWDYKGDVDYRTYKKSDAVYRWYPIKKWGIYGINKDGSVGTNYFK